MEDINKNPIQNGDSLSPQTMLLDVQCKPLDLNSEKGTYNQKHKKNRSTKPRIKKKPRGLKIQNLKDTGDSQQNGIQIPADQVAPVEANDKLVSEAPQAVPTLLPGDLVPSTNDDPQEGSVVDNVNNSVLSESLQPAHPRPPLLLLNDGLVPGWLDDSLTSSSDDLEELKAMALRLKLSTRRPSYTEWRERNLPNFGRSPVETDLDSVEEEVKQKEWSPERKSRIDASLEWLRKELLEMRLSDHKLASQLMTLRRDIHRVKLQRSSAEHKVVLEQAFDQIEDERDEIAEVCDMPPDQLSPTLKQFGVTRMNISTRRFSVF